MKWYKIISMKQTKNKIKKTTDPSIIIKMCSFTDFAKIKTMMK